MEKREFIRDREGHEFIRAAKGHPSSASAAEVRSSQPRFWTLKL